MASPHLPVPDALTVPATFAHVEGYLQLHDPDLRLRRSLERPAYFVLERRCRKRPATNVGMRVATDMHLQARDGYIHVSCVHPNWLTKPWNIVAELKEAGVDLWGRDLEAIDNELRYEEAWAKETRRRRRLSLYRGIAGEGFDVLNRMNIDGERSRINNVGTVAHPLPA
jgi:hypothetical protein